MWTNAFFVFAIVGVVVLIATVIWAVRDTHRNKKQPVV
jgi:heme/copper-type cytochrome/quinol oxidase subunit 4